MANFNIATGAGIYFAEDMGAKGDGTTDDAPAIQGAINAISAAGGGELRFGPKTYALGSKITLANGVSPKGILYQRPSNGVYAGGTRLLALGSHAGFVFNDAPLAAQPDAATISASRLTGASPENFLFDGFTRGVHIGDLYNSGTAYCNFKNLYAINYSEWGFYFENCSWFTRYENLFGTVSGVQGTGSLYFGASQTAYNNGNLSLANLFAQNLDYLMRGIVFESREGARFNDITCVGMQSNQPSAPIVSQAATTVSGSADITVTDGTKFPVGLPVSPDVNANGFRAWRIYFVVSQVGNVIQVSKNYGDTAFLPTGATAFNLRSFGFPCLEIIGELSSNSWIQPSTFMGLDLEGNATCQLLMQNARAHVAINTAFSTQGTTDIVLLAARSSQIDFASTASNFTCDIDDGTARQSTFNATVGSGNTDVTPQSLPRGMFYDGASQSGGIAINRYRSGAPKTSMPLDLMDGSGTLISLSGITEKTSIATGTALDNAGASPWIGVVSCVPGADMTVTMTLIGTVVQPNRLSHQGTPVTLSNDTTVAGVTVTVTTASGETFGKGSTKTSYVIPQYGSLSMVANTDGTNSWWIVTANNGAT